jgi:hypothetical protein
VAVHRAVDAASQGKFWYMHDMNFENQKYLLRSSFSNFAKEIELDLEQYEDTHKHKSLACKYTFNLHDQALR